MPDEILNVVVGVIYNAHGHILISKRKPEQELGGLWEFPGGKVEKGETLAQALARELFEEIGIQYKQSEPLLTFCHAYTHRTVKLHVHAIGPYIYPVVHKENQPIHWIEPTSLHTYAFPDANRRIIEAVLQYIWPRFTK